MVFFSNSNIAPEDEYLRRLESAKKFAVAEGLEFAEDEYDHGAWLAAVRGLEGAPEGGARCAACFRHNLSRAAEFAASRGVGVFTTTLTVSPKKSSALVAEAARVAARSAAEYMFFDFKKDNGFAESVRLAKLHGLYRQNYCGCGL